MDRPLTAFEYLKRREETVRLTLIAEMKVVISNLQSTLRRLEENEIYPSGSGILQSRGPNVDRLCGILWELRDQREYQESLSGENEN